MPPTGDCPPPASTAAGPAPPVDPPEGSSPPAPKSRPTALVARSMKSPIRDCPAGWPLPAPGASEPPPAGPFCSTAASRASWRWRRCLRPGRCRRTRGGCSGVDGRRFDRPARWLRPRNRSRPAATALQRPRPDRHRRRRSGPVRARGTPTVGSPTAAVRPRPRRPRRSKWRPWSRRRALPERPVRRQRQARVPLERRLALRRQPESRPPRAVPMTLDRPPPGRPAPAPSARRRRRGRAR